MSKIFEALQKAGGEFGEIVFPSVVGEEPSARPEAATVALAHTQIEEAPPAAEEPPSFPAAGPFGTEAAAAPWTPGMIRTLPLRVVANAPILPFDGTHKRAAEQYRIVRTKIVQHPSQPRMLVITSPGSRDGKSVSAVNIAGALALKEGATVLLVDADFRRSSVADLLGLPPRPSMLDVLSGTCSLEEAMARTEQFPNLYVLSGSRLNGSGTNPAELLDSPRWKEVCAAFQTQFRFTIVDAPPVGAVADYDLIQAVCDGVIVVVRPDHTDRTLCLRAIETVPKAKLVGVLLNCAEEWFLRRTHDYYYYSSDAARS